MKGMSIMGWVVIAMLLAFLSSHPTIIHSFTQYIGGQYQTALKAPQQKGMPSFILRPGQRPTQNTQLTWNGKATTFSFNSTQVGNPKANYGVSIDNKSH